MVCPINTLRMGAESASSAFCQTYVCVCSGEMVKSSSVRHAEYWRWGWNTHCFPSLVLPRWMGLFQPFALSDPLLTQYSPLEWPKVSPPALSDPLPGNLFWPDPFPNQPPTTAAEKSGARIQTHLRARDGAFSGFVCLDGWAMIIWLCGWVLRF